MTKNETLARWLGYRVELSDTIMPGGKQWTLLTPDGDVIDVHYESEQAAWQLLWDRKDFEGKDWEELAGKLLRDGRSVTLFLSGHVAKIQLDSNVCHSYDTIGLAVSGAVLKLIQEKR